MCGWEEGEWLDPLRGSLKSTVREDRLVQEVGYMAMNEIGEIV